MPRQSPYVIELSKAERGELAARARKYTHHIRSRCPIVRPTWSAPTARIRSPRCALKKSS